MPRASAPQSVVGEPADGPSPDRPDLRPAQRPILHIVLNARSGSGLDRATLAAHPALEHVEVHWHVPQRGSDIVRMAEQAAAAAATNSERSVLVAVGGDGTLNAVANAAWPRELTFGAVTGGTFNFFARDQGLAADPLQALGELIEAARLGHRRPVQVGLVNTKVFLVNASLGLYVRVLVEREEAKARFGRHRLVALLAAVRSLVRPTLGRRLRWLEHRPGAPGRWRAMRLSTLFVDNNDTQWARVGLGRGQAEGDEPPARATEAIGQGTLGVLALPRLSPWPMVKALWKAARGRLAELPSIEPVACTGLRIEPLDRWSARPVRVAFDGETQRMTLPLEIRVAPRPLWLAAAPRRAAGGAGGAERAS